MNTTAVAWTDMHLGQSKMAVRQEWMLDAFLGELMEISPKLAICCGDIFDRNKPGARAVEYATQWFGKLAQYCGQVVILPGNHDIDMLSQATAIDFLDDVAPNITIMYEPETYMDMLFVPYMRNVPTDVRKMVKTHKQVFMHQGIDSVFYTGTRKYGTRSDAIEADTLVGHSLVVCGHIHLPCYMEEDNVYLLGAPYQLNYADPMLVRGYGMWDLTDASSFRVQEFPVNYYLAKLILNTTAESIAVDVIEQLPAPDHGYYYDVTVICAGQATKKDIAKARASIENIYPDCLDSVMFNTVLPEEQTNLYEALRSAASIISPTAAPVEMLRKYTENKSKAFFNANPELRDLVLSEFEDIQQHVDEQAKKGIVKTDEVRLMGEEDDT